MQHNSSASTSGSYSTSRTQGGSNAYQHHHHHRESKRTDVPPEGLFCRYSHRVCMQNRLEGYEYCIKHILEDPNAPYRQCTYISNKTGKRCMNAASRTERKDGYCAEHTRRTILLRQKASRKRKPQETPETLLEELEQSHHRGNAVESRRARNLDSLASRILEYASSSDSDAEGPSIDHAWIGDGDSDAESVDSEQEDPLKHAGIYTAEEVALITRDKLIRLQSLYIDQFKRLQHLLCEKKRKYLHTVNLDRDQHGSVVSAVEDPEQKDLYDRLKAMKRYHKRYGKEALLHRQSQERRRQVSEGANYRPPSYPKCTYQLASGGKCGERTIPLSKFCIQHILEDQFQVLFNPCNFKSGNCQQPVAALQDEISCCLFHTQLPPHQRRLPSRQSSEDSTQSAKDNESNSIPNAPVVVTGTAVTGTAFTGTANTNSSHLNADQTQSDSGQVKADEVEDSTPSLNPSGKDEDCSKVDATEQVREKDTKLVPAELNTSGPNDPASEGDSEDTTTASEKTDTS